MKQFFSKYSYKMVSVFVTQFAISIFGNVLALSFVNNTVLCTLISLFAIFFNLFLLYTAIWDVGAKDKPAIDGGRMKPNNFTGLFIALGAYIPSYILTLIYAALLPTATTVEGVASTIAAYIKLTLFLLNGAYTGVMSAIKIGENYLNDFWWIYLVISIPTIAVCAVSYILGTKDIHFTKLMLAPTPEEQEIKRDKKNARKNQD